MDQARHNHYLLFAGMIILHFIAMYFLMYAMVNDLFGNFFHNLNQFYMAGLMTSSMAAIELVIMGFMYPNKKLNIWIISGSVLVLMVFWIFTRQQVAIGDQQFIRSMIPHHSGAILMCERTPLSDQELNQLCTEIIENQRSEIDQMKRILDRIKSE